MVFKSKRKSMKINKCLLNEIGISKDFYYGGTILRKQRKKRKSENISKIGIFGNLDLISQNSEFDCVDSF